jgi:hypothetical protein
MDAHSSEVDPVVPEHFLAWLFGALAICLGATVWSAMAAVFGPWSLPAAPGLGWAVAWACRYGGRRSDAFVRSVAWLQALAGVLLALFAFSAFSVAQTSPDSGLRLHAVRLECLRLFAEPPWFGSAAVLLVLAGAWSALREPPRRGSPAHPVLGLVGTEGGPRPGAPEPAKVEPASRVA